MAARTRTNWVQNIEALGPGCAWARDVTSEITAMAAGSESQSASFQRGLPAGGLAGGAGRRSVTGALFCGSGRTAVADDMLSAGWFCIDEGVLEMSFGIGVSPFPNCHKCKPKVSELELNLLVQLH
jgi:hypothetical protein